MASGTIDLDVVLEKGNQLRVQFGRVDDGTYDELLIRSRGRWKLGGRRGGRPIRVGVAAVRVERRAPFRLRIELTGPTARVLVDGAVVLEGTYPDRPSGGFGVLGVNTRFAIDGVTLFPID
jgi:hypothetical protein